MSGHTYTGFGSVVAGLERLRQDLLSIAATDIPSASRAALAVTGRFPARAHREALDNLGILHRQLAWLTADVLAMRPALGPAPEETEHE